MKTVQGDPDAVIAARDSAGSVPLASINEIARDPAVLLIAPVIETAYASTVRRRHCA
jgi:hypothetical protein